jgi:hypothetical protein
MQLSDTTIERLGPLASATLRAAAVDPSRPSSCRATSSGTRAKC